MKINQVEELTGIPKKNIRFYEDQKLVSPQRNLSNGYREYSMDDVALLNRIKLFRKLGIPIESIRKMENGEEQLAEVEDEALLDELAAVFEKHFEEMFDDVDEEE